MSTLECDFNNKRQGPNQVLRRGNGYGACKFEVLLNDTQLTTEVKIKSLTKAISDTGQKRKINTLAAHYSAWLFGCRSFIQIHSYN